MRVISVSYLAFAPELSDPRPGQRRPRGRPLAPYHRSHDRDTLGYG
jgi:hypothetical protein